jgi:hypothetical protein
MPKPALSASSRRTGRDLKTAIKIVAAQLNQADKLKNAGKPKVAFKKLDTSIMDAIAKPAQVRKNKPARPLQAMQDEISKAFGPRHKVLKRSGMRPLAFDGTLIAEASSHTARTRMWYEINLYRSDAGGYIAEVKLYLKPIEQKDVFRAEAFADLASMTAWLEAHDPAHDAVVDCETADGQVPLVVAALGAVKMRQAMDEARREYRYLVGELLYALGVTAD